MRATTMTKITAAPNCIQVRDWLGLASAAPNREKIPVCTGVYSVCSAAAISVRCQGLRAKDRIDVREAFPADENLRSGSGRGGRDIQLNIARLVRIDRLFAEIKHVRADREI